MDPQQLVANLKRLAGTLTRRQIATLAAAFTAVVAIVVGSAYWVSAPTYTLLYTDLDPESANAVVTRLKTEKIPYILGPGGRSIEVPTSRVDELRLDVAAQGLLTTGRIGFEVFDRTAFGTTEFLEHVNYQRGLEGELARTIGTIADVSSARVHLALAKESLFVRDTQPAKASVVLKLRNSNRPLASSTIAGIAGLVAASVESLRPESVVIIDTFGRPLSKPQEGDDPLSGLHLERQQQVERALTMKVVDLLEPLVGAGHVRVNVSARLESRSHEETEERWDPTTVLRSRQSSIDQAAVANAQGIAGARANAPPNTSTALPPAAAPTPMVAGRTTETANYEVGKVTRHTLAPSGQLARLSVAVIVDDERKAAEGQAATNAPRNAETMERIKGLVAAAVGLDAARGDQLTVENIAFDETPVDQEAPLPWWRQLDSRYGIDIFQLLRIAAIVAIAALAFIFVLRPIVRLAVPQAALPEVVAATRLSQGKTVAELESELDAAANGVRRLPALTRRLAQRAEEQPEDIARLVRSWLTEGES